MKTIETNLLRNLGPDEWASATRYGTGWGWEVRIKGMHFAGAAKTRPEAESRISAKLCELAPDLTAELEKVT